MYNSLFLQAMSLELISARLEMLLLCHILNPLWQGRAARHATRRSREYKVLSRYFLKHNIQALSSVAETEPEKSGTIRIWTMWLQGEESAPALVKSCLASIRRFYPDSLTVLDSSNLEEYLSLPETIMEKYRKGLIRNCHFADICRIELLHRYGGIWLDATCFMTSPIPQTYTDMDFFMYSTGDTFVQNCFIAARKGAWLLEGWRAMVLDYWMKEHSAISYFMHQAMFRTMVENSPEGTAHYSGMPITDQGPTHRIWYSCADDPFDSRLIDELAGEGYFFQKTAWKDNSTPVPGSFREWILNSH